MNYRKNIFGCVNTGLIEQHVYVDRLFLDIHNKPDQFLQLCKSGFHLGAPLHFTHEFSPTDLLAKVRYSAMLGACLLMWCEHCSFQLLRMKVTNHQHCFRTSRTLCEWGIFNHVLEPKLALLRRCKRLPYSPNRGDAKWRFKAALHRGGSTCQVILII